jgi:N-sulfoglucosamine sulfohydrolase
MRKSLFWLWTAVAVASAAGLAPVAHAASNTASQRPNILFFIFDDWGWRDSGAYGSTWVKTPNFDRVAREGVRFTNAFTTNPKCSPCRATVLTGRNTWQLEEASCHNGIFPNKFAVYPDILESSGYAVGLVGKGWGPGDFAAGGWKRNPAGPLFGEFQTKERIATGISNNDYVRNFEAMLKSRTAGKPFSFWLGLHEPHRGYELNSGVRLGKQLTDITVPPYLPDLAVVRSDLADYAIEVESGDAVLGRVMQMLQDAGELDNTVLVVTSDHGMPFPYVKGQIHEDGFHIPMAIRWPAGIKPGRVVDDFVSMTDMAPTFLELAGLKPHPQMVGRSLVSVLRSEKSGIVDPKRDTMIVAKERHDIGRPNDWGYPVRAIRTTEYLYVRNFFPDRWPAGNPETDYGNVDPSPSKEVVKAIGGYYYDLSLGKRQPEEFYRLKEDPAGVNNLAGDPAFAAKMRELSDRMFAQLRAEQDPRALGNGTIFDTYKYTGPRTKGYDTWLKAQEEKASAAVKGGKGKGKGKGAKDDS